MLTQSKLPQVVAGETSAAYWETIVVVLGDTISPGDQLGLLGNSGGSSEPHLHCGISRRDSNGFLRSLPMTFQKIKDGAGNTVSGVPVDNDFYTQP